MSGVTFTGLKNGETLTLDTDYTATGTFGSADAGEGKSVNVTVTLANTAKANNYNLTPNTTTATADITKADPVVTDVSVSSPDPIYESVSLNNITLTHGADDTAGTVALDAGQTLTVGTKGYGDVATSAWYTEAVRWATSQGIVSGYGNGMFGPNDNITREQLAVMLWRYAGSPAATEKELHFTDADKASGYALEALRWAVENGVMGGYGNGQLAPQGLATRAQVAQMLMNFLKNR